MLFNSIEFMVFFPLVTLLFFALPHGWRWFLLLASSCYFYMAFVPVYILILAFTILIDYTAGIFIEDAQGARRRSFLLMSIAANVGVLAVFKYFNFLNENVTAVMNAMGGTNPLRPLALVLPIGLSFHTFQSLSYTIEVYRGHQKAERDLGMLALYVMFYPQLVAGPIERPQNLLHQLRAHHTFDPVRARDGMLLMLWGLFKKVVIADRLAIYVNEVYNNPDAYQGLPVIIATYFFAFQIYCDFSGYSDIAIGAAQVMGIRLMDNFNRPYFSKSIAEFWKRWHISLSTWFRDYLYVPLGGSRVARHRWYANIVIVFLVSGLWHGANWTYVIWGLLHGGYMVASGLTENLRGRLVAATGLARLPQVHKLLRVFITFHLVAIAWVFFRAASVSDAWHLIRSMPRISTQDYLFGALGRNEFVIGVGALIFMECVHLLQRHGRMRAFLADQPTFIRWGVAYAMVIAIMLFGQFQHQPFIYFQF
jgi:D-alanyl-lipoteichoic acid acyltransferase DltB (MBOAT superfamily)